MEKYMREVFEHLKNVYFILFIYLKNIQGFLGYATFYCKNILKCNFLKKIKQLLSNSFIFIKPLCSPLNNLYVIESFQLKLNLCTE